MTLRMPGRSTGSSPQHARAQMAAIDTAMARIEFEPDGRIRDANRNFLDALGYSLSEIVGQHHRIFLSQEERESDAYRGFWSRLANGETYTGEFRRITKSGESVYIEAIYSPIRDDAGRVTGVLKVANNVTERANTNLINAAMLEAIGSTSAVIEFQPDGTILKANTNFLAALGYRLDEIVGRHHRMFCLEGFRTSPEYRVMWDSLARGVPASGEFERVTKTGASIWIQGAYNPVKDATGRVVRVIKVVRDVTEQVRMRESNGRLIQLMSEKLSTLDSDMGAISVQNASVSDASIRTAQTVQGVAAATEELHASIADITSSANDSQEAVSAVAAKNLEVRAASDRFSNSANSMSAIVELISSISGQINLLALNATIESARAGEAGRGFAVVASEVKSLSVQVSRATEQIAREIETMQDNSGQVVQSLSAIAGLIERLESRVSSVTAAVTQQSHATQEIARSMQAANTSVRDIEGNITAMATRVGQSRAFAEAAVREITALR
jgi:methyl-accepting chemotaxis protein